MARASAAAATVRARAGERGAKRGEALTDRAPEMAATPGSGMAVLGTVKRDLRSVAEVSAEVRKR